jgi:hypothetical protein
MPRRRELRSRKGGSVTEKSILASPLREQRLQPRIDAAARGSCAPDAEIGQQPASVEKPPPERDLAGRAFRHRGVQQHRGRHATRGCALMSTLPK